MRQRGVRSQSALARHANVAQSTIHRILHVPGYAPTRHTLIRLARALDTTSFWLSDGIVAVAPRNAIREDAPDAHPPSP